jgi:hypothetical protein
VPGKPHGQYRHKGAEDGADAHPKRGIIKRKTIALTGGLRRKRVPVNIIGE